MQQSPTTSIIIPHFNQPDALRDCLASLAGQIGVDGDIEIIVADNGSDHRPTEICAEFSGVKLIDAPTPGPGPARNAGVAAATANMLAFIDADCIAEPTWLATIQVALRATSDQPIGGAVLVKFRTPTKPTFVEPFEAVYSYRNDAYVRDQGFSGTGNLAMQRHVYEQVGPFASIGVAEDRDWGLRATALGIRTRYVDEMIIYHPARESFAELQRKWDRHIAHDWAAVDGRVATITWIAKAVAMPFSPLAELPTLLTTRKIAGAWPRLLALACLARLRIYRGWRMAQCVVGERRRQAGDAWRAGLSG